MKNPPTNMMYQVKEDSFRWRALKKSNCRSINNKGLEVGLGHQQPAGEKENRWMIKKRGDWKQRSDLVWFLTLHTTLRQQRDVCTHVHPEQPQSDTCYSGFHAGSGGFLRHHRSHYSARQWSIWNFVWAETYFTKALLEQSNSFFSPALKFGSKAKMKL